MEEAQPKKNEFKNALNILTKTCLYAYICFNIDAIKSCD